MVTEMETQQFTRVEYDFKNTSQRFYLGPVRNFKPQYSHLYYARLQLLRRQIEESAIKKWGEISIVY